MAQFKLWPVSYSGGVQKAVDYAANPEKTTGPADPITWGDPEDFLQTMRESENNKEGQSVHAPVEAVLEYAENGDKTEQKCFVSGVNCDPNNAAAEFQLVKRKFLKEDGILCWHGEMSYKEGEVTPEQAHKLGIEFAEKTWGKNYQVVVTTHLNTDHIHNHFVINSVGLDGKKLAGPDKHWIHLRHKVDEFCREHDLSVIEDPELHGGKHWGEKKAEQKGEPTRYTYLRDLVDGALETSRDLDELQRNLRRKGCYCKFDPQLKYWTVTPPGSKRGVRLYHLGQNYTNEAIQYQLAVNAELDRVGLFVGKESPKETPTIVWNSEAGRKYRATYLDRQTRMYLYMCHMLGIKPGYPAQVNRNYIPPQQLQREMIRFEKLNRETMFLVGNHLETTEQLHDYQLRAREDISILSSERDLYRRQIRSNKQRSPEEIQELKEKITLCTNKIRRLRSELVMCDDIEANVQNYESLLIQLDQQMEQEKQKEEEQDESKDPVQHLSRRSTDLY